MDLFDEFRRHADECSKLAKQARTSSDRKIWQQMAARWVQCAEVVERDVAASRNATLHQHRKPPARWLHH